MVKIGHWRVKNEQEKRRTTAWSVHGGVQIGSGSACQRRADGHRNGQSAWHTPADTGQLGTLSSTLPERKWLISLETNLKAQTTKWTWRGLWAWAPGFDSSATSAAPTPNEINDLTHKKSNCVVARFGFFSYFYLVIRVIQ